MILTKENETQLIEKVRKNPSFIIEIENPSEQMCLIALKEDVNLFDCVPNKSKRVELEILKHFDVFEEIIHQDEEICLTALFKHSFHYHYIHSLTDEMERLREITKTPLFKGKYRLNYYSYREIRSLLVKGGIELNGYPYHVLDCLYSY